MEQDTTIEHGRNQCQGRAGPIDLKIWGGPGQTASAYSIKQNAIDLILETYQKVFGEKPVTATSKKQLNNSGLLK